MRALPFLIACSVPFCYTPRPSAQLTVAPTFDAGALGWRQQLDVVVPVDELRRGDLPSFVARVVGPGATGGEFAVARLVEDGRHVVGLHVRATPPLFGAYDVEVSTPEQACGAPAIRFTTVHVEVARPVVTVDPPRVDLELRAGEAATARVVVLDADGLPVPVDARPQDPAYGDPIDATPLADGGLEVAIEGRPPGELDEALDLVALADPDLRLATLPVHVRVVGDPDTDGDTDAPP